MPPLKYVGRNPDSDSILVPKSHADTTASALAVTNAYTQAQISAAITNNELQTTEYVDQQDALRAKQITVDLNDLDYLAASQLNALSGVAGLDADGDLISGQVPAGMLTDRVAAVYTAAANGTVVLGSGQTHTVSSQTIREYLIASITIPDPGYPFRIMPFGSCRGAALSPAPSGRTVGNNIYGQLTAIPTSGSDQIYGVGICTATNKYTEWPILPYGTTNQNPLNTAPLTAGLTLGLYGCCYYGNGYTFNGTGLVFWALIVPAMGGD